MGTGKDQDRSKNGGVLGWPPVMAPYLRLFKGLHCFWTQAW